MKVNSFYLILLTLTLLLTIPLIAMQFTEEVQWSLFDFVFMGVLLLFTGLGINLVLRKFSKTKQRILLIVVVLGAFFLIWADLAVGIFGSPFAEN